MLPAIAGTWADRARRLLPPGSTVYVTHTPVTGSYRLYSIEDSTPVELSPYLNMLLEEGARLLSPEAQITLLGRALWSRDSGMDRFHAAKYKRWLKSLPDGFPSDPNGHIYSLRYL